MHIIEKCRIDQEKAELHIPVFDVNQPYTCINLPTCIRQCIHVCYHGMPQESDANQRTGY